MFNIGLCASVRVAIKSRIREPIDDSNIYLAVNMWCNEKEKSRQRYGDISTWDVSRVTNMSCLFYGKEDFNDNINSWDVSNVTNMYSLFNNASSFNQPLNQWNVSKVETMKCMFEKASSFNQPINDWDVSKVRDMSYMFFKAAHFDQPLSSWDVSNVQTMRFMFCSATSFNQHLYHWVRSVGCDVTGIFNNAESLQTIFKIYLHYTHEEVLSDMWSDCLDYDSYDDYGTYDNLHLSCNYKGSDDSLEDYWGYCDDCDNCDNCDSLDTTHCNSSVMVEDIREPSMSGHVKTLSWTEIISRYFWRIRVTVCGNNRIFPHR